MFDIDPLEYAFEHVRSGLALVDGEGVVVRANRAGAALVGRTVDELTGTNFAAIMHPDDLAVALSEQEASTTSGFGGPVIVRISRPDGTWVWIRGIGTQLPTEPPVVLVMFEDVTEERRVHERLVEAEAASARRAAQQTAVAQLGREALSGASITQLAESASKVVAVALDVAFAGVMLPDDEDSRGDLLLVGASGVLSDFVGHYRHESDAAVRDTLGRREPTMVTNLADDPGDGGRRLMYDAGIRAVAATPIVPRNAAPGLFITGREDPGGFDEEFVTFLETIANVLATALDSHQAVDDLRFNALHDDLTGLPNRALLLDRLELGLEQSEPTDCDVAVLVCDLDRFKVINDGMGHAAGDEVLRMVSERLRQVVRAGDTVGRFGGDEFVIVCPEIGDIAEVVDIAERLAEAFRQPMDVLGAELVATASIGIALGHDTGPEPAAGLLRDADAAMYRAKARGRARYELFDDDMRAWAGERLRIETELRHAIAHDELVLHYQPVLAVDTGEMVGVEALVRWQHPERGLLPPLDFLGVAEDAGILPELGRWAFAEAARQTAAWVARGDWGDRWTAVNLSPQEITDPHLVERISAVIDELGLDAASMRIELTEDALIEDTEAIGEVLDAVRGCGLGISVDDFGTGYSSLAYLRRLPVDCLKVDRTFVSGLGDRDDDAVIASAVISLGAALGLDVVAEGVETTEQLEVLRRIGCNQVQGYLFARPMPADALADWLLTR